MEFYFDRTGIYAGSALALAATIAMSGCASTPAATADKPLDVAIAASMPSVDVMHNGQKVTIQRNQNQDNNVNPAFAKTSRKCPPFCIQPAVLAPGVQAIGELEVIHYLKKMSDGDKSIMVVDTRTPDWVEKGTIPGAVDGGAYFLTSLPPGLYILTVYYNDATFSRGNVLIQIGKEAVVNVSVDSAATTGKPKGEVIEITGTAPLVDQGSTKTGITVTDDYTRNIPTSRTFGGVVGSAAGAQGDAFGISLAGYNFLISTAAAVAIFALIQRKPA